MFMPVGKIDIKYCKKNYECVHFNDPKNKLYRTEFWEELGDLLFTVNKIISKKEDAIEYMRVFTAGKAYVARIPLNQLIKDAY